MKPTLHSLARRMALLAPIAVAVNGDDLARESEPCGVRGSAVLVYRGSRLFAIGESQLGLSRGRALACASPDASAVLAALAPALQPALGSFPNERLREPLRVHLDPRLPPRHAPVTSIEVHATSREILVNGESLAHLARAAWTHELIHALGPAPPIASPIARRLWLTLEEGLVSYLTSAFDPAWSARDEPTSQLPLLPPAWEELALPEYDPHWLAPGLELELTRAARGADASAVRAGLLSCLTAEPDPTPDEPETLRAVVRIFTSRCAPEPRRLLESAAQRWLPEPLSPWPAPRMAVSCGPHLLGGPEIREGTSDPGH